MFGGKILVCRDCRRPATRNAYGVNKSTGLCWECTHNRGPRKGPPGVQGAKPPGDGGGRLTGRQGTHSLVVCVPGDPRRQCPN